MTRSEERSKDQGTRAARSGHN